MVLDEKDHATITDAMFDVKGSRDHSHIEMDSGLAKSAPTEIPPDRVPRLARLMALAIRMEGLVRGGEVADYADIARLGHVTRARVSQIMNLLCLAPDIQEAILFLPRTEHGRDAIREHHIRPILTILDWRKQRRLWSAIADGNRQDILPVGVSRPILNGRVPWSPPSP